MVLQLWSTNLSMIMAVVEILPRVSMPPISISLIAVQLLNSPEELFFASTMFGRVTLTRLLQL